MLVVAVAASIAPVCHLRGLKQELERAGSHSAEHTCGNITTHGLDLSLLNDLDGGRDRDRRYDEGFNGWDGIGKRVKFEQESVNIQPGFRV